MGFWSIAAPIVGGLLGFAGSRGQARAQQRAAAAAAAPKPYDETRSPWGPVIPFLQDALGDLQQTYQTTRDTPLPRPPGYSGPGGIGNLASYGDLRDLAGLMRDRAGDNSFVTGAQDFASSLFGGASTPLMDDAAAAATARNAALDRFMDMGFSGGFNPSAGYLEDWLASREGGPGGRGAARGQSGTSRAINIGSVRPREDIEFDAPEWVAPERPDMPVDNADYENQLYADEIGRVLSGQYLGEGNPYAADLIENLRNETLEGHRRGIADLDRRARAEGRYGSGAHQLRQGMQQEEFDEAMAGATANILGQIYESERGRMMQGLGLENQRDLARWNDLLQRYGIDTGAAVDLYGADLGSATQRYGADLSSATSRYNTDVGADVSRMGIEAQMRAQNAALAQARAEQDALDRYRQDALTLQGINALTGNQIASMGLLGNAVGQDVSRQQYGAGMLGDLFGTYLGGQTSALGMVPGLNQANYYGPQAASDAFGNLLDMEQRQAAANAAARNQAASARYRHDMMAADRPMNLVQQYLGNLASLATLGGDVSGTAPGGNPPAVANANLAGLQGALGGALLGHGLYNQFGGGGNLTDPSSPANSFPNWGTTPG